MNKLLEDLAKVLAKHNVTLQGHLLVRTDGHPQKIEFQPQAKWGPHNVRGHSAVVFLPEIPQAEPVEFKTSRAAYVSSDIEGYTCPVTGKFVDGRRDHRENLKRTGCRVLEPGEKDQFIKERPREAERNAERAADFLSDRIAERWPE